MDFESIYDEAFEDQPKIRRKSKRHQEVNDSWIDDSFDSDFEDGYKSNKRRKSDWDPEQHARKTKKRKNRRPREDDFDF